MSLSIGPQVPRRGHAFSRFAGRTALRVLGWKLEGAIPDLPRMVLIGAPHTTNFDGVIAISALIALGLDARTMIKDSAFRGLLGVFLRWAGAIPIDRRSPKGVVEQSIDAFARHPRMLLLLAPEGTRSAAPEWKRGFHRIAHGAQVPILPAACNYEERTITFGEPLMAGDDYEGDLSRILAFVARHAAPRHPERLSRPLCERMGQAWQPSEEDGED